MRWRSGSNAGTGHGCSTARSTRRSAPSGSRRRSGAAHDRLARRAGARGTLRRRRGGAGGVRSAPARARPLRAEALLESAAERIPGLVPTAAEVAAEREQRQADKVGVEIAQGLLLSHVLANPRTGAHLVWAMLRPTEEALAR